MLYDVMVSCLGHGIKNIVWFIGRLKKIWHLIFLKVVQGWNMINKSIVSGCVQKNEFSMLLTFLFLVGYTKIFLCLGCLGPCREWGWCFNIDGIPAIFFFFFKQMNLQPATLHPVASNMWTRCEEHQKWILLHCPKWNALRLVGYYHLSLYLLGTLSFSEFMHYCPLL